MRCLVALVALVGCGDNLTVHDAMIDAPVAPAFRHPIDLDDTALATRSIALLQRSCNGCHGLTKPRLRAWGALSDAALATCLTDLAVTSTPSARAMIDCARAMPIATADFSTRKLGIFATAAHLPWFAYAFDVAYGPDAPAQLAAFHELAAMPRGELAPFSQDEFDIVAEWFVRGLPALDATLVGDPPPASCTPMIAPAVATHTNAMAMQGWRALNAQNLLAMHDITAAPFAPTWDVPGRGRIRILDDETYVTSFWTRSSADGRFVAHGVANLPGSYVVDLQRDVAIPIDADYDPAFFPDNAGFVFQGGPRNTCVTSVLTSNPSSISMTEPGCSSLTEIGLYEHVGKQLGGGDYLALDSSFVSDDGGKIATLSDPLASFVATATTSFTPMIFDGSVFVPHTTVQVPTPFEGDAVLSPSSSLSIARLAGPDDRQLGYVLRSIDATFAATEIARYCLTGGKPGFSYDERWVVFHHYEPTAVANLYLLDLVTGTAVPITDMQPGQYALFPHFRSDGWIYAQVRDAAAGHEYTIASDAVLVLE